MSDHLLILMNNQNSERPKADPFGAFISEATGVPSGTQDLAANMVKDYALGRVRDQYEQNKGYFSFLDTENLKVYFDVTNSYVLKKLLIILFPFLVGFDQAYWKRTTEHELAQEGMVGRIRKYILEAQPF